MSVQFTERSERKLQARIDPEQSRTLVRDDRDTIIGSFPGKPGLKKQANSGKPNSTMLSRRIILSEAPIVLLRIPKQWGNVQRLYTCRRNVKSSMKRESTSVSNSGSSVTSLSEVRVLAGEHILATN